MDTQPTTSTPLNAVTDARANAADAAPKTAPPTLKNLESIAAIPSPRHLVELRARVVEDPAAEDKAEGTAAEDKAENPAAEDKAEGPAAEDKAEGTAAEDKAEGPAAEGTAAEGTAVEAEGTAAQDNDGVSYGKQLTAAFKALELEFNEAHSRADKAKLKSQMQRLVQEASTLVGTARAERNKCAEELKEMMSVLRPLQAELEAKQHQASRLIIKADEARAKHQDLIDSVERSKENFMALMHAGSLLKQKQTMADKLR